MSKPSIINEALDATAQGEIDLTKHAVLGTHTFVGIRFTDNSDNTVTPSAGTYSLDVKPLGMDIYEPVATAIDATASPSLLSFAANVKALRYTPTGVTGANLINITLSANLS